MRIGQRVASDFLRVGRFPERACRNLHVRLGVDIRREEGNRKQRHDCQKLRFAHHAFFFSAGVP